MRQPSTQATHKRKSTMARMPLPVPISSHSLVSARLSRQAGFYVHAFEGRRMHLNFAQCIPAVKPFAADWTFVVFKVRYRVLLTLEFTSPVPTNLPNLGAIARRTLLNLEHIDCSR